MKSLVETILQGHCVLLWWDRCLLMTTCFQSTDVIWNGEMAALGVSSVHQSGGWNAVANATMGQVQVDDNQVEMKRRSAFIVIGENT
jgi:hypothetical protein